MLSTIFDKPSAVALGTFDGLHKGHTAVIDSALAFKAQGLTSCVLLFDKHPQEVLAGTAPLAILSESLRLKELDKMGVCHFVISFEDVRDLTAIEFLEEILIKRLNAKAVCCGYDYHFGHDGADATELKELCQAKKIECKVTHAVKFEGLPISSTRIRTAIKNGDLEAANAMLGRAFAYDFEVIDGKKRGRKLGIPTINQSFPQGFVIPKVGVYVSTAIVDGSRHASVTDIGFRPTFNGTTLRSETSIVDFSGDLYGDNIEVRLMKYLRAEKKFSSPQALVDQIKQDIQSAREYFLLFQCK
ncbi:MAG TPA: bifunctional riboflavin kinase/FAD synthetase [Clostridia bacterium]|nr:bifunctional riboflavin kinase/FAD synthetase [Clostridia bacterium]